MNYPTCCQSAQCGQLLCDGCANRPVLVKFYERKGPHSVIAYEARQDQLREDKAAKRGAFAFLKEAAS